METKKVLISGAGIAGLTLAFWLEKYGFSPTLIEKRPDLSDEGYMIDFLGPGFDVAEKMGLKQLLHDRAYPINQLVLVNEQGRQRGALDVDRMRQLLDNRWFNLMRGDLEGVLYQSICDRVPIQFGTQVSQIVDQGGRLQVALSSGEVQEADLVIGADGIHSHVRAICWGEESQFEHFLGYYVACAVIDNFLQRNDTFYSYLAPKSMAAVYAIRDNSLATFFTFKSGPRDASSHLARSAMLKATFGNQGWLVPRLLADTLQANHLYFDAVSQIQVDPWHKGRVALVGDACQCLTLLAGQGASMAMYGSYVLADALRQADGNHVLAYPAYQEKMRPLIEREQAKARKLAGSFVPNSRFSIWLTALVLKAAFLPGFRSVLLRQFGGKSKI